jgi:membrane protein implicated in regulation of membrane protease activity
MTAACGDGVASKVFSISAALLAAAALLFWALYGASFAACSTYVTGLVGMWRTPLLAFASAATLLAGVAFACWGVEWLRRRRRKEQQALLNDPEDGER